MKCTKKAKPVDVKFIETSQYYAEYTCPTCKVTYCGGGPYKNTIRFKCECGQELVIKKITWDRLNRK